MFAAIGRFTTRHRRLLLFGWLIFFVVGIVVGAGVFGKLKDTGGNSDADSVQGQQLLDAASTHGVPLVAVVDGPAVNDPSTAAAVQQAIGLVAQVPGVTGVATAYDDPDPAMRSVDGTASLIVISTAKTDDMAAQHSVVEDVRGVLHGSVPGASVTVGGQLAVMHDEATSASSDLSRGQMICLPILLVALFFVFRGWRAAVLPILAALATVAGALLLVLAITNVVDVASYAIDVIALFGLVLAVDYSLLMVNRFREERGDGADVPQAVERTVAAAGRTITFSALTVIASLAGLFAFGDSTFSSLAIGGIATTALALAAGLTLIPALLAGFGRRIKPMERAAAEDGPFGRLARWVQCRPILVVVLAGAALLAAGLPFLSANYGSGDPRTLPASYESRQVYDTLATRFPGHQADPIQVVAQLPADDPRVQHEADQIRELPGVALVSIEQAPGELSVINVVPAGSSQGPAARDAVTAVRADRPDFPVHVTGSVASLMDFQDQIATRLPWALALIALATMVLLFLMTGSVLVPLKAIAMNILSLGATFGALVWIFQDGHLSGLLGFQAFGAIEVWCPIVVFVFAFGLSMDYEVFLLSRIKESYDECGDSDHAVATGLQRSGRIITSAAMLVIIAFLGFAVGQNLGTKQMGVALAVAVLVDATLVRCLLVPATMTLLGRANWWAPRPLRRIHDRFGLREAPAAGRAPEAGTEPEPRLELVN